MESNPYAPPQAPVADVAPTPAATATPFFAVSSTKLIVMCLVTLTLYQLVWFYKNWAHVRARGNLVIPIVRAIFAVFFCYSLFDRIRNYRSDLPSARLAAGPLATGWIIVTVVSGVFDRIGGRMESAGAMLVVTLLLGYASILFLLPVQSAVNEINRHEVPDHDPNSRFTVWNWLWSVVGVFFTLAGIVGTLLQVA